MRLRLQAARSVFLLFGITIFGCTIASAQTDVALSFYGAFTQPTNLQYGMLSPSDAAGGIFEFRHVSSPLLKLRAQRNKIVKEARNRPQKSPAAAGADA